MKHIAQSETTMLARRSLLQPLALICWLAPLTVFAAAEQSMPGHERGETRSQSSVQGASGDAWRGPLATRNQFPLSFIFVAIVPERSVSLAPGVWNFSANLDYSNIISSQEIEGGESLTLDLEYLRTNLRIDRGFGNGFQLGVSLPFYSYGGGFLDPLVDNFHEALNLPNFLRGQTEHGLVQYRYGSDGANVFDRRSGFGGMGDLAFHVKKILANRGPFAAALRGAVELPTGSVDELTGNEGVDAAAGFAFERVGPRFGMYGAVNVHFLGKAGPFESQNVASVLIGGDWKFKPNLAASAQIEVQTSPLLSQLEVLDQIGRQVALGLRWNTSEHLLFEWRFVEDLSDLSPDFTVGFELRYRFDDANPLRGDTDSQ